MCEHRHVDAAVHDQVVVSGQADLGQLDHGARARLGVGVVADQVAQAPELGRALLLDRGQH